MSRDKGASVPRLCRSKLAPVVRTYIPRARVHVMRKHLLCITVRYYFGVIVQVTCTVHGEGNAPDIRVGRYGLRFHESMSFSFFISVPAKVRNEKN